jgi:hypothetical protein
VRKTALASFGKELLPIDHYLEDASCAWHKSDFNFKFLPDFSFQPGSPRQVISLFAISYNYVHGCRLCLLRSFKIISLQNFKGKEMFSTLFSIMIGGLARKKN